jgi:hypothetical protein
VLGQVTAVLGRYQPELAPVQHQRGRLDPGQQRTGVDRIGGVQEGLDGLRAGDGALQLGVPATEALVVGAAGHQQPH